MSQVTQAAIQTRMANRTIDGYTGAVNTGEFFVIKSENKRHQIRRTLRLALIPLRLLAHGSRCRRTFWLPMPMCPIVFAQGNDLLFFCDGVGPIYAWNGKTIMNLGNLNTLDWLTGSVLTQEQHRATDCGPYPCLVPEPVDCFRDKRRA